MANPLLRREDEGPIMRLTLDAPERFNALSDEMLAALKAAFTDLAQDQACRVIVLAGNGKAFCAGHDLHQMQAARQAPDGGRAAMADLFARCAEVMQMIRALPQPVIAEVHGIATAAGCQLVASCDMAVAATGTRFGVNGINIGLFCSTPMVALTRAVPPKVAFEMLSTGQFIDADRAREVGLINKVVPPDQLRDAAMALATLLAQKLPAAMRYGKAAFYAQAPLCEAEAYALASATMVENLMEADTDEGISAFLEKRAPTWAQPS